MILALLTVGQMAIAQKIDKWLTELVQQPTTQHRVQGKDISREAVTDRISVKLNDDGTVCSMSAIATLKKGAECLSHGSVRADGHRGTLRAGRHGSA